MTYEHIHGVDEVIRRLREFPVKFEQNIVRGGLRAMAVVVQTFARPLVPVGRGVIHPGASASLADTLRVSTYRVGQQMVASVKVGNIRKGVFYAHMVLGGTRPHLIRARGQGMLRLSGGTFVKQVQHPGARPNPFLDVAFNASRDAAVRAGFDYVTDRTKKLIQDQGDTAA
jgi:hypothetical protein